MTDHSKTPINELRLESLAPQDLIAENFHLCELTRSELASRLNVNNTFFSDRELQAAVNLTREILQPIRAAFGSFTPNSVFRSHALERVLKHKPSGWLSTSQHTQGCACDIEIVGKSTLELAQWAADTLPDYDQIICECYDPREGPNSGWVHLSLKAPGQGVNRKEQLSYVRDKRSGKWVYIQGLKASVG